MVHAVTVEPMGLSGGLALFWNDTIQLVTLMILLMDRKNKEEEVEILGPLETLRILYGGAIDLGHKGKSWAWWCYMENDGIIQERLDRVLVSPNWRIKFENENVQHIETEASDHSSLMLSFDMDPIRKKKRFYFDRRWIEREGV
ncbi:hypothetical protein KY285_014433 [Solanum tuberosum]|nr:hypothetical protein KY285_014433 [Solanum tuberosum]